VTLLLDTHFLIWLVIGSTRLNGFPWLDVHRPWGVSPVSLLEIRFLAEAGRLNVHRTDFVEALENDRRFIIDDPSFAAVFRHAFALNWTRDPFDRLLAAHSLTRRVPLCSTDDTIRRHHGLLPGELQSPRNPR